MERAKKNALISEILKGFKSSIDSQSKSANVGKDAHLAELHRLFEAGTFDIWTYKAFKADVVEKDMAPVWYWYGEKCTEAEFYELEKKFKELASKESKT